jgi:hypothetical protein
LRSSWIVKVAARWYYAFPVGPETTESKGTTKRRIGADHFAAVAAMRESVNVAWPTLLRR